MVIYGNAGSGKTTMARVVVRELGVAHLSLDDICWADVGLLLPLAERVALLESFIAAHPEGWVIDGCYGDLVEAALPHCSELRFLNPGIEVCVRNCRSRPWEPAYCESPEQQARLLEPLIDFVRQYETRQDEFSLARHRAIFDSFSGAKRQYITGEWR
jgi:hypothetical protein